MRTNALKRRSRPRSTPADARVVAVADVGQPLRVHVLPGQEHVDAAAHVDDLLDEVGDLLLVQRLAALDVARTSDRPVREQRDDAGRRERDRFLQELPAVADRAEFSQYQWPQITAACGPFVRGTTR